MKSRKNNREDKSKLFVYTLTMILTIVYILYRIIFTLPFGYGIVDIIFGVIVLLLEIGEILDFSIFYFNILRFSKRNPYIPSIRKEICPDVDVFIATINESEELLEETIIACLNMEYPKKKKVHIYLCDDGHRSEMENLAKKYKINYITRENNQDAKAGNYNNALAKTSSPYIATFDADMRPTPDFLITTIPFFIKDETVGFVQLPQSFSNPDIFQLRFGLSNSIPFEQDYFYKRIQLAKNHTNSTVYCGTNAVLSRRALEETNGFALNTITEDIATGMLIESKGYKGISLSNVEAYGNSVHDLEAFLKQRSRWARGNIQILKHHKIIRNKGLTIRQKLDYLSAISYWFYGVRRILYLIIPLLFSLFGVVLLNFKPMFIVLFFSQYLMKKFALDKLEDNRRSSIWNEIYEIILAPIMAKEVLKELFGFGSTKFEVTPKNKIANKMSKTNKKLLLSHLMFFIFSVLGFILTIIKIPTLGVYGYLLLIWLVSNIIYLLIAIIFDLRINPIPYDNFSPDMEKRYRIISFIKIFTNIFKRGKKV